MKKSEEILRRYFGHSAFRPGQAEIIDAILAGRDALAILPTGAGKSVCFAIPALLLSGTTLVISPLIALMDDQVRLLQKRGIPAERLHASLSAKERRDVLYALRAGRLKLLYISPERLGDPMFFLCLKNLSVPLLAVDEAHCISQWGHAFRPSYLKISRTVQLLAETSARPVIAAFTASATAAVQEDISKTLGLIRPFLYRSSIDRRNLRYLLQRPCANYADEALPDAFEALLSFLHAHRGQCGIIYCRTKKRTTSLQKRLQAKGIPGVAYHAGLPVPERKSAQARWLSGDAALIVATNAFGMGVNKSDVRFVVHFGMPPDLESYYQEAGRAGRDGAAADCLLLPLASDLKLFRDFRRKIQRPAAREAFDARLRAMLCYASGTDCLRRQLIAYFESPAPPPAPEKSACRCSYCSGRLRRPAPLSDAAANQLLCRELRARRNQLAGERRIAAAKIASNRLLQDLSIARPTNRWQLLLTGVSPLRFFLFDAPVFLDDIRLFCALYGLRSVTNKIVLK